MLVKWGISRWRSSPAKSASSWRRSGQDKQLLLLMFTLAFGMVQLQRA